MGSRRNPPVGTRIRTRLRSLGRWLRPRFSIDPRSLAAFRIALGTTILVDLWNRSRDLPLFYTDAGVLPREQVAGTDHSWTHEPFIAYGPHMVSGDPAYQTGLFVVAALVAGCLVIGYRTRLATIGSLGLLLSLHARNPLLLNGGDYFLSHLLFLAVFLPLGERWSVDALGRTRAPRETISGFAAAAILVHAVGIFFTNAYQKHRGVQWLDGTAMHYALHLEAMTTPLAHPIRTAPVLPEVLTYAWLGLLSASVFLLVVTGWPRFVLAGSLMLSVVGMALTIQVGIFPHVLLTAAILFVPPTAWRALGRHLPRPTPGLRPGPTARRELGSIVTWRPPPPDWLARFHAMAATPAMAGLCVFIVAYNLGAIDAVGNPVLAVLGLSPYGWNMFAPNIPGVTVWYAYAAETTTGERVDALNGGEIHLEGVQASHTPYPGKEWRRISNTGNAPVIAGYLCDRLRNDGLNVEHITTYRVIQTVDGEGFNTTHRSEITTIYC